MNPTTGSIFTAIIEREGNLYVALCPELDIASQGTSIENALENLKEAVALFIETADPGEMKSVSGTVSPGSTISPRSRPLR
jgi:predicted RNase H-like HicB family nuclease